MLPIHNTDIQAASTYGKMQREHTQLRDNKHSEAERCSHLSDLQASGLAPISKDRTVQSRFSCISTQRLLSPSASAELKQTRINNNNLTASKVRPCSPSPLKKLSDVFWVPPLLFHLIL